MNPLKFRKILHPDLPDGPKKRERAQIQAQDQMTQKMTRNGPNPHPGPPNGLNPGPGPPKWPKKGEKCSKFRLSMLKWPKSRPTTKWPKNDQKWSKSMPRTTKWPKSRPRTSQMTEKGPEMVRIPAQYVQMVQK